MEREGFKVAEPNYIILYKRLLRVFSTIILDIANVEDDFCDSRWATGATDTPSPAVEHSLLTATPLVDPRLLYPPPPRNQGSASGGRYIIVPGMIEQSTSRRKIGILQYFGTKLGKTGWIPQDGFHIDQEITMTKDLYPPTQECYEETMCTLCKSYVQCKCHPGSDIESFQPCSSSDDDSLINDNDGVHSCEYNGQIFTYDDFCKEVFDIDD